MFKNKHIQVKLVPDQPESTEESTPIEVPVEAIIEIFDHLLLGVGALIVLNGISKILVARFS